MVFIWLGGKRYPYRIQVWRLIVNVTVSGRLWWLGGCRRWLHQLLHLFPYLLKTGTRCPFKVATSEVRPRWHQRLVGTTAIAATLWCRQRWGVRVCIIWGRWRGCLNTFFCSRTQGNRCGGYLWLFRILFALIRRVYVGPWKYLT